MEFSVSMAFNATNEITAAGDFPSIRVFTGTLLLFFFQPVITFLSHLICSLVNKNVSLTPIDTFSSAAPYEWGVSSPTTIGGPQWQYFSATCYFFGREVYKRDQTVPVGLVASDWGGTYVQAWSSPDALAQCNTTATAASPPVKHMLGDPNPNQPSVLWNAMIYPLLNVSSNIERFPRIFSHPLF